MTICALIKTYQAARDAWDKADPDGNCDGPEWDALEAAEDAILRFPCTTIGQVRAKARFFIETEPAYDTIRNCYDSKEEALIPFLRSLLGEVAS